MLFYTQTHKGQNLSMSSAGSFFFIIENCLFRQKSNQIHKQAFYSHSSREYCQIFDWSLWKSLTSKVRKRRESQAGRTVKGSQTKSENCGVYLCVWSTFHAFLFMAMRNCEANQINELLKYLHPHKSSMSGVGGGLPSRVGSCDQQYKRLNWRRWLFLVDHMGINSLIPINKNKINKSCFILLLVLIIILLLFINRIMIKHECGIELCINMYNLEEIDLPPSSWSQIP